MEAWIFSRSFQRPDLARALPRELRWNPRMSDLAPLHPLARLPADIQLLIARHVVEVPDSISVADYRSYRSTYRTPYYIQTLAHVVYAHNPHSTSGSPSPHIISPLVISLAGSHSGVLYV